jgi:hypothetical protein
MTDKDQVEELLEMSTRAANEHDKSSGQTRPRKFMRPDELIRIDDELIDAEYRSQDKKHPFASRSYEEFKESWVDAFADDMALTLVASDVHLATISDYHANPEVRSLARALQYHLYAQSDGTLSTKKYEDHLDAVYRDCSQLQAG